MQFMVTNGGAHSAGRWAEVTANAICDLIQIDPSSNTDDAARARLAKDRLRSALIEKLAPIHARRQEAERAALNGDPASLSSPMTVQSEVDEMVETIVATAATSPFGQHFATPQVKAFLKRLSSEHMIEVTKIERSLAADRLLTSDPLHSHATEHKARNP